MEGEMPTETSNEPEETESGIVTRRRVMKASAALAASGIVDTAGAKHATDGTAPCMRTQQCQGTQIFQFSDQQVGDPCTDLEDVGDSVEIDKASLPCGGFIDVHDPTRSTGPSSPPKFGAGYPVGATSFIPSDTTVTDKCIDLFEGQGAFGACIDWNNDDWPTDANPNGTRPMVAMLHLDTDDNQLFTHYCDHESASRGVDHAYLCDYSGMPLGPGTLEPILRSATVTGDGTG